MVVRAVLQSGRRNLRYLITLMTESPQQKDFGEISDLSLRLIVEIRDWRTDMRDRLSTTSTISGRSQALTKVVKKAPS